MPLIILGWKFELIEMPEDACHGHGAVAPWWTKIEIKVVILDIRIARNASLQTSELEVITKVTKKISYRRCLSSTQMLSYRFGNGRFLSNAENLTCHAVSSSQTLHDTYNELLAWLRSHSSILEAIQCGEYEYAVGTITPVG